MVVVVVVVVVVVEVIEAVWTIFCTFFFTVSAEITFNKGLRPAQNTVYSSHIVHLHTLFCNRNKLVSSLKYYKDASP